jgi:hypothetical protein
MKTKNVIRSLSFLLSFALLVTAILPRLSLTTLAAAFDKTDNHSHDDFIFAVEAATNHLNLNEFQTMFFIGDGIDLDGNHYHIQPLVNFVDRSVVMIELTEDYYIIADRRAQTARLYSMFASKILILNADENGREVILSRCVKR